MITHYTDDATPTSERLYVLPRRDRSLVVRGWIVAELYSKWLGINPTQVRDFDEAHEQLRRAYGYIPESAQVLTTTGPGVAINDEEVGETYAEIYLRGALVGRFPFDPDKIEDIVG